LVEYKNSGRKDEKGSGVFEERDTIHEKLSELNLKRRDRKPDTVGKSLESGDFSTKCFEKLAMCSVVNNDRGILLDKLTERLGMQKKYPADIWKLRHLYRLIE